MWAKKYSYIGLLTLASLLIYLQFENTITLYIHPRYVVFTVTMSVSALFLLLLAQEEEANESKKHVLLLALIAIITLLPSYTLSERTASNRQQQSAYSQNANTSSFDDFSQDFTHFDIADWQPLLSNSDTTIVVGKEARVEGFIFEDSERNKFIAKFKLSCCAVDATPLTIPIRTNEKSSTLETGKWYKISGTFVLQQGDNQYVLDIESTEEIKEPEDPYVF